ncbi:unnamed protein product [Penicillium glandicola]
METKSMTTDVENAVRVDPFGIPLHPPPTTDPLDPLNWSRKRKALILFIVCFSSFLSVFLTGTPIASFSLLEEQFDASYSEVNWTLAIPSLGLGTGALLLSKLADTWGRRPVLISTCAFTMLATGCTTVKSFSYEAYMAFRFLQGLGAGPCTVIGFGIIRDISWEHERGFNVGLWVLSVDTGGIAGALLGGFTAMVDQYWAGYLVVIAYGLLLLLEVSLLPETLYPRELVLEAAAAGRPLDSIRRTTMIDVWLAAFIEPWFINYWVESVGYTWSFVTQGLITLLVIPSYYMVQNLGRQMDKTMEIR